MTARAWWTYPLQAVLWASAMGLLMRWMVRSRVAPTNAPAQELRYSKPVMAIGIVGLALAFAGAFFAPITTTRDWFVKAFFVAFGVPCAYLVVDYARSSFRVGAEGLEFCVPLQGSGLLRWSELERVSWSSSLKWFVLRSANRTLRIPVALYGLPVFARTLLEHVSSERITPDARLLLERTAQGSPPAPW